MAASCTVYQQQSTGKQCCVAGVLGFCPSGSGVDLIHVANSNSSCQVMHGGLFSEDGVTLEDLRKIERNRQPPDSGTVDFRIQAVGDLNQEKTCPLTAFLLFHRPHVRPALVGSAAAG